MFIHKHQLTYLTNYKPKGSHYLQGEQQAIFGITADGKILLSDILYYSEIDALVSCFSIYSKVHLDIYCWKNNIPELYVFDTLKRVISDKNIQATLKSLVGVHFITKQTPVICNEMRETIFYLQY